MRHKQLDENGNVVATGIKLRPGMTLPAGHQWVIDDSGPDSRSVTLNAIAELEMKITPRRIREALVTGDKSFIESIEAQVAALRATL